MFRIPKRDDKPEIISPDHEPFKNFQKKILLSKPLDISELSVFIRLLLQKSS
jgi:hypothetical protein